MVTPLRYFKVDPNGLGRGAGIYYHRGHGIFSKYDIQVDYNRKSKGYRINPVGLPKKSSFLHTGDGNIPKYFKVVKK